MSEAETSVSERHQPCPFCGSRNLECHGVVAAPALNQIYCVGCEATGPDAAGEKAAWAAWDRIEATLGESVSPLHGIGLTRQEINRLSLTWQEIRNSWRWVRLSGQPPNSETGEMPILKPKEDKDFSDE